MSDPPSDEPEGEPEPQPLSGAANVADPKAVRQRKRDTRRKAKREEDAQRDFWRAVFASPEGRHEMWGILDSGHAFDEKFVATPTGFDCPEATWCQAGEQRLAFRIYLSWLRLCPEGVALMMAENHPALIIPKS
ncbi:MAG: hypothetical protein WBV77_13245 [Solirubrobacteraceae bacterium]